MLINLIKSTSRLGVVGVLVAASLAVSACGDSDDSSSANTDTSTTTPVKTENVNMMLEWTPNASQVWAIAGEEEGKFAQNGVKPKFLFPDDSTSPVKVLLAGKADFVLQLSTGPAIARGQGEGVKVVGTLEALDVGIMVPSDKITDPKQLKGGTIGIGSSTYNETCLDRLLEKNGMTKKDVKVVDPAFNLVAPLIAGKVQGVNGSQYEQAIALVKDNLKTTVFAFQDNGCPMDPIQIITTDKMIKENPELVKATLKGIAESLEWSMDNPEDAAAHWAKAYPELDPKSDLAQWQASVPTFCTEPSEEKGLLYSDPKHYEDLIQLSADAKVIDKAYPVEDLVTNEFLPEEPITAPCADERWKQDPLEQITGL